MGASPKGAENYRFGPFTLHPAERLLTREGTPVVIGQRGFDVLRTLLERAGTLVDKSELAALVWGDRIVGDNTIHAQIAGLRRAIGEDHILTKQGQGYRFVTKVSRISPDAADPAFVPLPDRTRLIGRDDLLREVADLVARSRLTTLTGPGGVGKTRLAKSAGGLLARRFPDGVWMVELARLQRGDQIEAAIAAALGVPVPAGSKPLRRLVDHLAGRRTLLLLDNCDGLVAACAELAQSLLAGAPGLHILATSRERLGCPTERILAVTPLGLPDIDAHVAAIRRAPAVELFLERARGADPAFDVADADLPRLAALCRRVDGLPLAIELVAIWAPMLGIAALEKRIETSFVLRERAPDNPGERPATMKSAFDWSYAQLPAPEKLVLRRLSVFPGAFTLEMAEDVASCSQVVRDDMFRHLGSLVRKSLLAPVREQPDRPYRYRLLETTRMLASERLDEAGETRLCRRQHARHVLGVLENALREWDTTTDAVWLDRYRPWLDDTRAALDFALGAGASGPPYGAGSDAVALAGASWPLWRELSLRPEGQERLAAALPLLHADTPPDLEARLHYGLGDMSAALQPEQAAHAFDRAATLYRQLRAPTDLGRALNGLGYCLAMLGRIDEADSVLTEALAALQASTSCKPLASHYNARVLVQSGRARWAEARAAAENAAMLFHLAGAERSEFSIRANIVALLLMAGDPAAASLAGQTLAEPLRHSPHSDILCVCLGNLTSAMIEQGRLDEAAAIARETVPLMREYGLLFRFMDHLALLAGLRGRHRQAALLLGHANAVYAGLGRTRRDREILAHERLSQLLDAALGSPERDQLIRDGGVLTSDQALALAADEVRGSLLMSA
jgi:predicted ATPase/DNA-binding winged helix-turn-helix (wHTH) protein